MCYRESYEKFKDKMTREEFDRLVGSLDKLANVCFTKYINGELDENWFIDKRSWNPKK